MDPWVYNIHNAEKQISLMDQRVNRSKCHCQWIQGSIDPQQIWIQDWNTWTIIEYAPCWQFHSLHTTLSLSLFVCETVTDFFVFMSLGSGCDIISSVCLYVNACKRGKKWLKVWTYPYCSPQATPSLILPSVAQNTLPLPPFSGPATPPHPPPP